ncbi:MAG: TonB-dependent receptor [Gemmatimonadaceae bacterium]|nr:TonB-dependent receptor [Gemmatimonadaceae bacterium]
MPTTSLFRALALLGAALVTSAAAAAQSTAPAGARPAPSGEIRGRLVETSSGQPITIGSVAVRRASDSVFVGGALPDADGGFRVSGLTPGRYVVRFRAIGFAPFVRAGVELSVEQPVADLGRLTVAAIPVQLQTQTVTAERPDVALAPDRNSYSTKNMPAATGGTAVDVLRNVPSVEVDGDNNVSLRGNQNVVVQINGRPSPLHGQQLGNFLAQLPASTVTRVEVASNPSAKDDPEGTAGIINIVLNQQADMGWSGGVNAGAGSTGMANVSGNLGRQEGPFTFLGSYSFFRDERQFSGYSNRENLFSDGPAFVNGRFEGTGRPLFQNATLRAEYKLSERDAFTADAVASGGRFNRDFSNYYANLDSTGTVTGLFNQFSGSRGRMLTQDYALAFRRIAPPKAPLATTFSTELRFNENSFDMNSRMSGAVVQADAATRNIPAELDVNNSGVPLWSLQSDFAHPFGTKTKLELGAKGTQRTTSNDFTAAYRDANGVYVDSAQRASSFDYHEQVGAVYGLLSQKVGRVDAQGGLRLENAQTNFALPNGGGSYRNGYGSAFPSAVLAWNVTDLRQLKASYSRRITRPDPFQLSPIERREDPRNVFVGNPNLRPEYTDAFELGLQDTKKWGSLQLTPYYRKTAHAVRFIRYVDTSGVSVGTFANVASSTAAGADLNVTYRLGGLNLFGGGGAYRYSSDAGALSTKAFVWTARSNATWKLSPTLDLMGFLSYRAAAKTEGGTQHAFVFTNLALRQKLFGDKGSLTVRVQDPFNLSAFGYDTRNGQVIERSERKFGMRGVVVTFSRNFGQALKLRPRQVDQPDQTGQQVPGTGP